MKNIFQSCSLLFLICSFSAMSVTAQIQRPIGTNLAGVVDWSSEFVFVDVMKQSRDWIAHDLGPYADWSSGVDIPLRADGYPLEIPYDNGVDPVQGIRTVLFADLENVFPGGEYRLIADGVGELQFWGAASATFSCPVDTILSLDNTAGILGVEILESEVNDPVHNIRLVMPGFHNTFTSEPFHPELLSFLEDFQVIRFMDWMKTNGSNVQEWTDRNTTGYFSQTLDNGIAYEYMIELCNILQKDIWVNIPHQASDDFILQFAQLLRDQVDPNLKIYLEYSNEVWNSIFSQNVYATEAAIALGYTGQPWDLAWQYTARRSADLFHIFENEFIQEDRLIKVVPGFAANGWVNNYILERFNEPAYNLHGVTADALAIAPYFGGVANTIGDAGLENSITVAAILDSMENSLPETYAFMDENRIVADDYGLDLIAYEGGQHLVAYYPYSENEAFVNKLLDANRDPRMEDLYCSYFDYWFDVVEGGIFAHFSSHGGYSKYGAWGVKETYDDMDAPKYLGLQNCVFSYNTITTSTDAFPVKEPLTIFPTLVKDQFTIRGHWHDYEMRLYDVNGRIQDQTNAVNASGMVSTDQLGVGMYFVHFTNRANGTTQVVKIIKQ